MNRQKSARWPNGHPSGQVGRQAGRQESRAASHRQGRAPFGCCFWESALRVSTALGSGLCVNRANIVGSLSLCFDVSINLLALKTDYLISIMFRKYCCQNTRVLRNCCLYFKRQAFIQRRKVVGPAKPTCLFGKGPSNGTMAKDHAILLYHLALFDAFKRRKKETFISCCNLHVRMSARLGFSNTSTFIHLKRPFLTDIF